MSEAAASSAAWRARCEEAWALLVGSTTTGEGSSLRVRARPGGRVATLWPYTQVLHAAVLLGGLRGDGAAARQLGQGLERFRLGAAYSPGGRPRLGRRYYDDNAWVGLAAAQAVGLDGSAVGPGVLGVARRTLRWVRGGEAPEGGVRWREGGRSRHACSTGAAAVLALRALPPGGRPTTADVAFAERCAGFLSGPLLRPDGLVADHVDRRGRLESSVWAYNQGLAVGAGVLLHRAGVPGALAEAVRLAHAADEYLDGDDRLWRQPPCFVAVWFRMRLLLQSEVGGSDASDRLAAHLGRVWRTARSADGFGGSGMGAYGRESTLDLAAIVQMATLLATEPATFARLC